MKHRCILISTVAAIACMVASGAQAQSAEEQASDAASSASQRDAGLGEIVVTAQRRAERLQDVPLAITAVDSGTLERRAVVSVADLPSVSPGLSVGQQSGYSRIYIRGVGSGSISSGQDPSVSMQLDGIVIGRPFAQLASFFDVERVEVLRGPQGTLYGRNATGGTLNVVTRAPTREFSGYLDAVYGNYDHLQFNGAISGPLDKNGDVRGRIAFQKVKHDGYGRNLTLKQDIDDQDAWAVRASLQIDPVETVNISLTADYAREDDHNYSFTAFGPYRDDTIPTGIAMGGIALVNSRNVTEDAATTNDRKFWGLSATIGVDLGSNLRLQTILGYRDSKRTNTGDVDTSSATPVSQLLTQEFADQFSAELQLLYQSDHVNGVVGAFYYNENLTSITDLGFPAIGAIFGFPDAKFRPEGDLGIKAKAIFTQWTVEPVDGLRLTAGVRYSDERRKQNGLFTIFNFLPPPDAANAIIPTHEKGNWNAVTPRFVIDYSPTKDVMLYASATRGFKSGVILIGVNPPVNPEYIWAYEGGIKSTFLNNRLQFNVSGFYYDFTNLQVNRVVENTVVTENAATASIKGLEMEIKARPVPGLTLNTELTYLDAKYDKYFTQDPARPEVGELDLSGNKLSSAPKWSISGGIEADIPVDLSGRLSVRGDVRYSSRYFFSEFNDVRLSQGKYAIVDASLQYESDDATGGVACS